MAARLNPHLLPTISKYGNVNIEKCFNCGNCTAICPLSVNGETFPRRMIRYAQLGLEEPLLSSKELWQCYACGQCTQTCPRQADPSDFMAAARRYAIAKYDPLGFARLLLTSPVIGAVLLVVIFFLIALVVYSFHGIMPNDVLKMFDFIPAEDIHNLGLVALAILMVTGLMGAINMILHLRKEIPVLTARGTRLNWWSALWETLVFEVLAQRQYRKDCETSLEKKPFIFQKWFIHAATMWGFLGLLAATGLDFLLGLIGVKPTGTLVPIWYPIRLLGTIAGLFLVYGTTMALINRFRKADESTAHSTFADWALLILLWATGVSGFALEIAIYLPQPQIWAYWMLIGHIAGAIELIILAPFTKFAHVLFRSIAMYIHLLKPLPETRKVEEGAQ